MEGVVVGEVPAGAPHPVELQGLPLGRLPGHRGDDLKNPQRAPHVEHAHVVEQRPEGHRQHRVADVHRDGHAVGAVQGLRVAALLGAVLDVVVNQERVVVQLQHGGRGEHRLEAAAERPTRRDAERRAQPLGGPQGIVHHEVVEHLVGAAAPRHPSGDLVEHERAAVAEVGVEIDGVGVVRHRGGPNPSPGAGEGG